LLGGTYRRRKSMKILAIIGSSKGKGYGYSIIEKIESEMRKFGDLDFEYLLLKNQNIENCKGCYICLAKGEDKCPLVDDFKNIEEKIVSANGVILSSPIYVMNISSLMKNFIERLAFSNHRPKFFQQKVLSVVNTGYSGIKTGLFSLKWALGGSNILKEIGFKNPP
jgi:multimeric flavodoxin WrbA